MTGERLKLVKDEAKVMSADKAEKAAADEVAGEATPSLDAPENFVNRELSLLEFQRRVLEEARDDSNPLLERAKFLSIVGSNLNEFFMVRVAGLKQQHDAGVVKLPPDGMTPAEQLAAVRRVATDLFTESRACWREELLPALRENGIHVHEYDELSDKQRKNAEQYFEERVFPVLTPLAFDPGRPFPHISNLSLNLAILILDPDGQERFARLKVPGTLPRLVPLKKSSGSVRKDGTVPHKHSFVWLEQLIVANLAKRLPQDCGDRSAGSGDQADALQGRRELAGGEDPAPGAGQRQGGRGTRRIEGPLR